MHNTFKLASQTVKTVVRMCSPNQVLLSYSPFTGLTLTTEFHFYEHVFCIVTLFYFTFPPCLAFYACG